MPLKVDYVNQIPSTATKIYDILDSANNKLFEDIKISDQTVYTKEGDSFGATDINATNTQVNANTQSISDIGTILGDVTVEQLAMLASVDGDIQNQLDDKAPLANPTFTGLITTAGQVAFPATQNPSSDPNTLDDYEEGTFTATFTAKTTPPTTPITTTSKYTKIGNIVYIVVNFYGVDTSGASGTMRVTGLPFVSDTDNYQHMPVGHINLGGNILNAEIYKNTTSLDIVNPIGDAPQDIVAGTNKYLLVSGVYKTND